MNPKTTGPSAPASSGKRWLIVTADDFGRSRGINRGIIRAHEHGIVTSASLMVRWPAAAEAAAYGREHPTLSVGLHVDLGEWSYSQGSWAPVYTVVPLEEERAVRDEISRQLEGFFRLAGGPPTHLDSHQHVHRTPLVRSALLEVAGELGVPLRQYSRGVRYCGDFFGQNGQGVPIPENVTVQGLSSILRGLPRGVTELGCHPGEGRDFDSMYRDERVQEVRVLCDTRVREVLAEEGIELCSFHSLQRVPDDPLRFRVQDRKGVTRTSNPSTRETL